MRAPSSPFWRLAVLSALTAGLSLWPGVQPALGSPPARPAPPTGPAQSLARDVAAAKLVIGNVHWRRGTGSWQPLKTGQLLRQGDELKTGGRSMATFELPSQAGLATVLADSRITISELAQLPGPEGPQAFNVSLHNGQALIRLRKFNRLLSRFRVSSPNGAAVVRGTEFLCAVRSGAEVSTTVGVTKGAVQVEAQGAHVLLRPGTVSSIVGDRPPTAARQLLIQPLQLETLVPADGQLRLAGSATPGSAILVNGIPFTVDETGRFSLSVPLPVTDTQVTIETIDPTGHIETQVLSTGS